MRPLTRLVAPGSEVAIQTPGISEVAMQTPGYTLTFECFHEDVSSFFRLVMGKTGSLRSFRNVGGGGGGRDSCDGFGNLVGDVEMTVGVGFREKERVNQEMEIDDLDKGGAVGLGMEVVAADVAAAH
ncbi:uncharacterized protein LOC126677610 [Mercurialis annua]|uniref:uncharacterized protein LOC126677610 n=1 Tax=Mercurialis annua TaxID=3986 RepID=UPI00215FD17C|nr:uncharacterized protein LOC126677610 [Mercurialis annua]